MKNEELKTLKEMGNGYDDAGEFIVSKNELKQEAIK